MTPDGWQGCRERHRVSNPAEGATIDLLISDKGLDDRNGQQWLHCEILVLEGWCIGVQAQPDVLQTINALETREDADGLILGE